MQNTLRSNIRFFECTSIKVAPLGNTQGKGQLAFYVLFINTFLVTEVMKSNIDAIDIDIDRNQ